MKHVRQVFFLLCVIPVGSASAQEAPEGIAAQLESDLINVKRRCREQQREMHARVDSLRQELVTHQSRLEVSNREVRELQQVAAKTNGDAQACKEKIAKVTKKDPHKPAVNTFPVGQLQVDQVNKPMQEGTFTPVAKAPKSSGPNLQRAPSYSDGSPGDEKADQVISPLAFPKVPGNTDWLDAHLTAQMGVLKRLYTGNALRSLGTQQKQFCGASTPSPYCVMQLRLYWMSNAL